MNRHLLVYDADCGPCTRFRTLVEFLDSYHNLRFTSLSEADGNGLLRSISPSLRHRSFHLLSAPGEHWSGAEAVPTLVSLLPSGSSISWFMTRAPGGERAIRFVYSAFLRLHDNGACGNRSLSGRSHSEPSESAGGGFGSHRKDRQQMHP